MLHKKRNSFDSNWVCCCCFCCCYLFQPIWIFFFFSWIQFIPHNLDSCIKVKIFTEKWPLFMHICFSIECFHPEYHGQMRTWMCSLAPSLESVCTLSLRSWCEKKQPTKILCAKFILPSQIYGKAKSLLWFAINFRHDI